MKDSFTFWENRCPFPRFIYFFNIIITTTTPTPKLNVFLTFRPSGNEKKLECSSTEGNTSTDVANGSTIVGQHDSEDSGETIGVQPDPVVANSNAQPVADSEKKKISPTTLTTPAPSMVQTVLGNRFVKTSKAQIEKITTAIAYFIAVACLPYSIVENIGFRYLMKILAPNYHVPSRKVFSHDRIPKLITLLLPRTDGHLRILINSLPSLYHSSTKVGS